MSLNNVIENSEYKLLFLKAINLGIMYGESKKSNFYKEKINNEINSIILSNINKNTLNNKESEELNKVQKNDSNEDVNKVENTNSLNKVEDFKKEDKIKKYDLNILNLENQKNIILQKINNLSINYS